MHVFGFAMAAYATSTYVNNPSIADGLGPEHEMQWLPSLYFRFFFKRCIKMHQVFVDPSGASQTPKRASTSVWLCMCDIYYWYYLMKLYHRMHISPENILEKCKQIISTQDALDKERGHTITDHSIFDDHGRRFEKELPHALHGWLSYTCDSYKMHNMPHVCDIYAIQCAPSNMIAVALWQLFVRSTLRTWKLLVSSSLMLWLLVRHNLDI